MSSKSNSGSMPMIHHQQADRGYQLLYWCCLGIFLPLVVLARLAGWRGEFWSGSSARKPSMLRDARRMARTIAAYVFNV